MHETTKAKVQNFILPLNSDELLGSASFALPSGKKKSDCIAELWTWSYRHVRGIYLSRIFISHSSKDNFAARAVADWLSAEGWDDVFLDIDPERGIRPGERWARALHEAAHRCQAVIFLISRNWLASEWCDREFNLAVKLNKRLFGVVIDDTGIGGVPGKYRGAWQLLDLMQGTDHEVFRVALKDGSEDHVTFSGDRLAELREGLRHAGLDPEFFEWPPPNDANRAPYRGLAPLEKADAGIFFGREAPLVDALDRLRGLREAAPPRILAILGASGAGKSSFLRAGILPRLDRDDRAFRVLPIVRPQGAPISGETGLITALASLADGVSRATIGEEVKAGRDALLTRLAAIAPPDGPTLVLPIDQAEELVIADAGPEAEPFLKLLRRLAEHPALPLLVLLTIRTDRYMQWQNAPALDGLHHETLPLAPMPRGAYRTIIEAPVARYVAAGHDLALDPRLTEALLDGLEQGQSPDALPLLAFTLEQLFTDYSGDGKLSLSDYRKFGGVEGAISAAVARALANARGDRTGSPPPPEQLALLKRGLIPWLAGIDPATNTARRKTALWSDIPEEAKPLMDRLIDARLLRSDRNDKGEQIVEPAHEALLRQWVVLAGWLQDDLAALSALDGVKDAARAWISNDRDAGYIVHGSSRLAAAEGLNQRKDLSDNLTAVEREYLGACRAAEDARRNRDLLEARRLAEAEAKAAAHQREVTRRTRLGMALAFGLAVVALGLAVSTLLQMLEAIHQQGAAVANERRAIANLARVVVTTGAASDAVVLALASWPRSSDEPLPRLETSLQTLSMALSTRPPASYQIDIDAGGVVPSPDGSKLLVWSGASGRIDLVDALTGKSVTTAPRHEGAISWASFSQDGGLVASSSTDGTTLVWDSATGAVLGQPMIAGGQGAAVFDPSGTRLLVSSFDHTLRYWEIASGEELVPRMDHGQEVFVPTIIAHGRRALTWTHGGTRLWNLENGELLAYFENERATSTAAGDLFASWNTKELGPVRIWSAETGEQIGVDLAHPVGAKGALFAPNGESIFTWGGGAVQQWEVQSGVRLPIFLDVGANISGLTISADGRHLAVWSDDNHVRLWSLPTGDIVTETIAHQTPIVGASFTENGRYLTSWSEDGHIKTTNSHSGSAAAADLVVPNLGKSDGDEFRDFGDVVVNPDGTQVVAWAWFGPVRVWTKRSWLQSNPMVHADSILGASLSRDEQKVLTWSADNTAKLWSFDGTQVGATMTANDVVEAAHFSSDERHVLTSSWSGETQIWRADSGHPVGQLFNVDHVMDANANYTMVSRPSGVLSLLDDSFQQFGADMYEAARSATFNRTGNRILASSGEFLGLWDTDTQQQVASFKSGGARFSPDGTKMVVWSSGNQGIIGVRDSHRGERLSPSLEIEGYGPYGAAFSSDETMILGWSNSGHVRLWNLDGTIVRTFRLDGYIDQAAISPDSATVVAWSDEDGIVFWDVETATKLPSVSKIDEPIDGVSFDKSGTLLATHSTSGVIRLFDVRTGLQVSPTLTLGRPVWGASFLANSDHLLVHGGKEAGIWAMRFKGLLSTACELIANLDVDSIAARHGVRLGAPICTPEQLGAPIEWAAIERLPQ